MCSHLYDTKSGPTASTIIHSSLQYDPFGEVKLDNVDDNPSKLETAYEYDLSIDSNACFAVHCSFILIYRVNRCDEVVDCTNISDEGFQCSPSTAIAYIIVGILTLIALLTTLVFLVFTVVYGYILPSRRVRSAR